MISYNYDSENTGFEILGMQLNRCIAGLFEGLHTMSCNLSLI